MTPAARIANAPARPLSGRDSSRVCLSECAWPGWFSRIARLSYETRMLPNLRLMLAGAAALFLVMLAALSLAVPAPQGTTPRVVTAAFGPRGALISQDDHPEWRQFLVQAALRRADELEKLKQLPDRAEAAPLRWASLPVEPQDHAPQDAADMLAEVPSATIPVEIGEASSTELPVTQMEEPAPPPAAPRAIDEDNESPSAPAVPEPSAPVAQSAEVRQAVPPPDSTGDDRPALTETEVRLPQARPDTSAKPVKAVAAKPVKRVVKRKLRRVARNATAPAPAAPQTANPFSSLFGQSNPPASQ